MVSIYSSTSSATNADPEQILNAVTVRLLALMFAAFDTTALTLSQVILDIITQEQSAYADAMRAEARSVLSQNGNKWSLSSLQDLNLIGRYM